MALGGDVDRAELGLELTLVVELTTPGVELTTPGVELTPLVELTAAVELTPVVELLVVFIMLAKAVDDASRNEKTSGLNQILGLLEQTESNGNC